MRSFLSKIFNTMKGTVSSLWKQMKLVQRLVALGVLGVLIVGVVVVISISVRPGVVYLFTNAVTDVTLLNQITNRLDIEGIEYTLGSDNRISVRDKRVAQYARTILVREDLLPQDTDPWELFDVQRWTQTDFERNVNLQRSITRQLEQHIESLDDVDNATVTIVLPEDTLFSVDQNPVTASIILHLKPGSNFMENRKKIEGVERLVLLAVEGLSADNLTINNQDGIQLNDFVDLADFDNLELTRRELQIKKDFEDQLKRGIILALSDIYTPDRVRIVNINVEMDFSSKSQEITENYPIEVTPDNPETPFDEREVVLSIPRSQENIKETYQGTGFNPEGPPGVEGQVPPSYKDLDGIVGSWDSSTEKINNEINQRKIIEESRPNVSRVTASVAIDGKWQRLYNDVGNVQVKSNGQIEREYIPLSNLELVQATSLVRGAVGFSQKRLDNISVENIQFDRTEQFALEDAAYQRQLMTRRIIRWSVISLIGLILLLLLVRFIVSQIELYKIRKEERLAEQYRRMREQQILAMGDEKEEVEETELQILIRNVEALVRERAEDVSALLKAWIEEK